jgi:Na+/proline symporter
MSRRNREILDILLGIVILIGMHIVAIFLGAILAMISGYLQLYNLSLILVISLFGIGLAQLIYVIPAIIILNRRRKWGWMKGVIIGAVITALLNGGCWLLLNFPNR